jgi:EAL domain-containing protein (putative c-di-GMP-specific phosphodiesterase class I)/DNA-binding SARP family transcriptional activator/FixJ family two-component response regulator
VSVAKIALLGRLSIEREDHAAAPRGLPGRRAELVFAYLAAEHHRTVSRDELAEALWPGALPDTWAAALRGVVSEVRRFLEDAGLDPAEVLASARGGYQLRLPPGVVVDLDEARAAFAAAREQLAGGILARAAAHAERAGALARLPFLPQHEGEWVDGVRRELESIHTGALELQVRAHAQGRDLHAAADAAERLVRAEPFSEAAHQLRIRVLGEGGDRAGAVAAYEHCRAVLAAELRVAPSAATDAELRRALERAPVAERRDGDAGGLAAYSVLVVEDHDFQRRTAVQLLRGLGVGTIAEAADGEAALDAIARSGPPDVIVCDLEMPGMDGVDFIRHVAERGFASAVIISSAMESRVIHAVEALAEAYGLQLLGAIEKPLSARRLGELLASHHRDPALRTGDEQGSAVTAADITDALRDGRMLARFRPLVDLATASVSGAGAIPGWQDPVKGWIGTPALMPVLEAEGLVGRFAEHMLDLACAHARAFARAGLHIDVGVRLPGGSYGDPGVADRFADIARERGADPRRIVFGIGERALKRDAPGLAALTRLRLKGFGVSLEDFGSAHSSAEQLAPLPLTAIKIAGSVVSGAAGDARRIAALEQALDLARGLGLVVAAAGCDSAADFGLLLQLGCRHAEGAFIADAMAGEELAEWAERWSPPSVLDEPA